MTSMLIVPNRKKVCKSIISGLIQDLKGDALMGVSDIRLFQIMKCTMNKSRTYGSTDETKSNLVVSLAIKLALGRHNLLIYILDDCVPPTEEKVFFMENKIIIFHFYYFSLWNSLCRLYTFITRYKIKFSKIDVFKNYSDHPMNKNSEIFLSSK